MRVLNTPQSLIEISIDCSVPGLVVLQHENGSEHFVARGGRTSLAPNMLPPNVTGNNYQG